MRDEIFNLWGKRTRSADKHSDGFGLGLYAAKVILGFVEGKIMCISEGHMKGTAFAFSLPAYESRKEIER
jgi:K+-sensing histidine kinase KdpD